MSDPEPGSEPHTDLELDGSDGGGQLLRTALTLAALTGQGFEMTGVRGSRPEPGLRPQHLACVEAVAGLTDAAVAGGAVGSETLGFAPTRAPEGDVDVDVGTAGSVALVFDTVLPFAVAVDAPVTVTASGGTDVKWAPTLDFLRRVKLPLLARHGLAADVTVERRGFYPVGGGRATLCVAPSSLRPFALETRGTPVASAHAVAAAALADDVPGRALARLRERLSVPLTGTTVTRAETDSPGFALLVSVASPPSGAGSGTRAGFDEVGERGVPAETVADSVVDAVHAWLDGTGVVDAFLADQLVVPLALGGGTVEVPRVTPHVRTSLELLEAFDYGLRTREDGERVVLSGPE